MKHKFLNLLMALATVAMALCLMGYLHYTGPLPGAENTVAADGSYTAAAKGYGGMVTVTMTIENGRIAAVQADASAETPALGGKAAQQLTEAILAKGNANVDAVAGATVTSEAVIAAAKDCLAQARR